MIILCLIENKSRQNRDNEQKKNKGKASISPRHVEIINRVFSPTLAEIDYAYEVLDAIAMAKAQGRGAISLRGKMIDAPIVNRAKQTIAAAEALGLGKGAAQ